MTSNNKPFETIVDRLQRKNKKDPQIHKRLDEIKKSSDQLREDYLTYASKKGLLHVFK